MLARLGCSPTVHDLWQNCLWGAGTWRTPAGRQMTRPLCWVQSHTPLFRLLLRVHTADAAAAKPLTSCSFAVESLGHHAARRCLAGEASLPHVLQVRGPVQVRHPGRCSIMPSVRPPSPLTLMAPAGPMSNCSKEVAAASDQHACNAAGSLPWQCGQLRPVSTALAPTMPLIVAASSAVA
jgi:hypothetical protein